MLYQRVDHDRRTWPSKQKLLLVSYIQNCGSSSTIPKGLQSWKLIFSLLKTREGLQARLPRALQWGKSVPFSNSIDMPESHRNFKGLYHTIALPYNCPPRWSAQRFDTSFSLPFPEIPFRQFLMTCPGLSMRWTKARRNTNLTSSSRASCYMHTYSSIQTHHLFCYGKNMHNIKLNILTF